MKHLKKLIICICILSFAFISKAQEIEEKKTDVDIQSGMSIEMYLTHSRIDFL